MEHISDIIKRLQEQDFQTSERIDKEETEIEKAYKKYRSETTINTEFGYYIMHKNGDLEPIMEDDSGLYPDNHWTNIDTDILTLEEFRINYCKQ